MLKFFKIKKKVVSLSLFPAAALLLFSTAFPKFFPLLSLSTFIFSHFKILLDPLSLYLKLSLSLKSKFKVIEDLFAVAAFVC